MDHIVLALPELFALGVSVAAAGIAFYLATFMLYRVIRNHLVDDNFRPLLASLGLLMLSLGASSTIHIYCILLRGVTICTVGCVLHCIALILLLASVKVISEHMAKREET